MTLLSPSLHSYFQFHTQAIEQRLDALVPADDHGPHPTLFEAARYALLGGGKRIRPILALATTEVFGGDVTRTLTPACALEIIHTYSLIHDDLPCMDDDDYRRGKPTVHKQYSEGHAVLVGDFLLTRAFEVIATDPLLSSQEQVALVALLARQSGGEGMIGGQVMDLATSHTPLAGQHALDLLHQKKTGALLTTALECGARLSGASPDHLTLLRRFGAHVGLAFQIVDDVLDVTHSQAKHGRAVASDVANGKMTYVSLLGIAGAQAHAQSLLEEGWRTLKQLPYDTSLLASLANFLVHRTI